MPHQRAKHRPSNLIERCQALPIEPILRELGAVTVPRGDRTWLRMICPFHDESTPSASVSHVERRFRCHACGVHGDAVALLIEFEELDFKEAVERAEEICGMEAKPAKRRERRSLGLM